MSAADYLYGFTLRYAIERTCFTYLVNMAFSAYVYVNVQLHFPTFDQVLFYTAVIRYKYNVNVLRY